MENSNPVKPKKVKKAKAGVKKQRRALVKFSKVPRQVFNTGCTVTHGNTNALLAECNQGEKVLIPLDGPTPVVCDMHGCFGTASGVIEPGKAYRVYTSFFGFVKMEELDRSEMQEQQGGSSGLAKGALAVGSMLLGALVGEALGEDLDGDFDGDDDFDGDFDEDIDGVAFDADGDGFDDTVAFDTDGDGNIDTVAVDTDGDGNIDTVMYDTDGDGVADVAEYDTDGDGVADVAEFDTDGDGVADALVVDVDHDGEIDAAVLDVDHDGYADHIIHK